MKFSVSSFLNLVLCSTILSVGSIQADEVPVITGKELTPGLSGLYYDTASSGQGLDVRLIDRGQGEIQVVGELYTYNLIGERTWYSLAGSKDKDSNLATLSVINVTGGLPFIPSSAPSTNVGFDPIIASISQEVVGTALLAFSDCGSGFIDLDYTEDGIPVTGAEGLAHYNLTRLTPIIKVNGVPSCVDTKAAKSKSENSDTIKAWRQAATFNIQDFTNNKSGEVKSVEVGANGTPVVGPGHTGLYYETETSGQGLSIDVIDRDTHLQVVSTLYSYEGSARKSFGQDIISNSIKVWYILDGEINPETNEAEMVMRRMTSIEYPFNGSGDPQSEILGSAKITFNNCGEAVMNFSDDNAIEYFNGKKYRLSRLDPILVVNGERACDDGCRDVDFSPRPNWCSNNLGAFEYSAATRGLFFVT